MNKNLFDVIFNIGSSEYNMLNFLALLLLGAVVKHFKRFDRSRKAA